jgi:hypothetical protein
VIGEEGGGRRRSKEGIGDGALKKGEKGYDE